MEAKLKGVFLHVVQDHLSIPLYSACPVCVHNNVPTVSSHWVHERCSAHILLAANLDIICPQCSTRSDIFDWCFQCPSHSNSTRSLSQSGVTSLYVLNALGRAINASTLTRSERLILRIIRTKLESR